ncbi:hypothetical protein KXR53_10830 [Inquilinus limosus]|uniref:hypothetical protein n=1 Tax=Inquilinus limosus TaxID=171674 RepID=UPI003F1623D3
MSLIGMTGLEPDDSMAQSEDWTAPETRSARVSWSEVTVAWVIAAVPVALGAIAAIIALLF